MACACKADQQIALLQKKYGDKNVDVEFWPWVKTLLRNLIILLILIPLTPIIFIILGIRFMSNKRVISIKKIINFLHKHGRK